MSELPVVVIGAGPQGLAAAAHLVERQQDVIVLERGTHAAAAVSEWGHVRLFSAWPELIDGAARRLLEPTGWSAPTAGYPSGHEWVEQYLRPLSAALGARVRTGTTVIGVSRAGRDRVVDDGRAGAPFAVHVQDADGAESHIAARAVIDASGTWSTPNPAGANGLPALGERAASPRISYRIPDDVASFAGQHVLVVGAGHSASHAVLRLADLVRTAPDTRVTWALRREEVGAVFGGGAGDELPQRAALGVRSRRAIEQGRVELLTGFRVDEIRSRSDGLTVVSGDGRQVDSVAHMFALTGFRPDTQLLAELRTALDPTLEAVAGIAEQIDPNLHSCGSVSATGATELAQPEPGLYIVGSKSYGRAPTFLALTGYEQVRSVTALLAGDAEGAVRQELVLPDTGVCGGSGGFDAAEAGCCAPASSSPALIQLTARPSLIEN